MRRLLWQSCQWFAFLMRLWRMLTWDFWFTRRWILVFAPYKWPALLPDCNPQYGCLQRYWRSEGACCLPLQGRYPITVGLDCNVLLLSRCAPSSVAGGGDGMGTWEGYVAILRVQSRGCVLAARVVCYGDGTFTNRNEVYDEIRRINSVMICSDQEGWCGWFPWI
jgi:hypothetical protein